MTEWFGLFAPARTPAALVQRAADAVRIAVNQPDFTTALGEIGMTPRPSTPQELAERLRGETAWWRDAVKRIGFTAES